VGLVRAFLVSYSVPLRPRSSSFPPRSADVVDLLLFILLAVFLVISIEGYRELNLKLQQQGVALHESEERLQTVVAELQHRTRSLVSVVGAMAKGTLKASKTFDDFSAAFQDRLQVLGRAQGLLFSANEYHFGAKTTFAIEADGIHCTILLPASEQEAADHPS
jgi:hypothetical protein